VNRRATNFRHFVLVAEVPPSPPCFSLPPPDTAGVLMVCFMTLSQECRKSQNFSSMSAIVAALQSIPHLILTRETKLTRSEKQLLPQLDEILAPQGDHRAYREALTNIKSPFTIPWLGAPSPPLPSPPLPST
jgi:hypothetical protein